MAAITTYTRDGNDITVEDDDGKSIFAVGKVLGAYKASELVQVLLYEPTDYSADHEWANDLNDEFERAGVAPMAPDYDADPRGFALLLRRVDFPIVRRICEEADSVVTVLQEVPSPGHYGDGQWSGVELIEEDGRILWVER